jgi:hypothetical protein
VALVEIREELILAAADMQVEVDTAAAVQLRREAAAY